LGEAKRVFFYKLAEGFKKKDPKNVLLVFTRIVRKNVYCLFFLILIGFGYVNY
jgi:hypothetical protein